MPKIPAIPKFPAFRRASGLALAAVTALVLAACSSPSPSASAASQGGDSGASGGTYQLPLNAPDGNIDPLTTSDYNAMFIVGLASAGLIIESPAGKLEPQLATSWTQSANKLSWTVDLRPGAKFSNGQSLTAKDVVATFDQILSPSSESPAASSFQGILTSVAAGSGGESVVFTLDRPYSDFPYLLTGANTWILPAGYNAAKWINDPIGAGQFVLEKYTAGQGVTYRKNPYYWDASKVLLTGIDAKFYNDDQSEVLAFQSGEIDQVTSDASVKAALGDSYPQETQGYVKFDGLVFNVKKAPFNNQNVRQAVAWALNRTAIASTAYAGDATVADDYATFPDYAVQPTGIPQRSQNLAKVRQLLGGKTISFTITSYQGSGGEQTLAELIQQQLDATGYFKVSLDLMTEAAYYANGSSTPWLNAPVTLTDWADRLPSQLYSFLYAPGSEWNASDYSNTELAKLSTDYEATSDSATRQSLANQIAAIEWTDVPVIIAAFEKSDLYLSKSVHGTFANGQNFNGGFDFRGITVSGSS